MAKYHRLKNLVHVPCVALIIDDIALVIHRFCQKMIAWVHFKRNKPIYPTKHASYDGFIYRFVLLQCAMQLACAQQRSSTHQETTVDKPNELNQSSITRNIVSTNVHIGEQTISLSLIARKAQAQKKKASEVFAQVLEEAWLAEAAREFGALEDKYVQRMFDKEYTRRLIELWSHKGQEAGPYREDEAQTVMGEDWVDLDRPESRRVVHALIRKEIHEGAHFAKQMHERLNTTSHTPEAFMKAAHDFAKLQAIPVVIESIDDAFTSKGLLVTRHAKYQLDPNFSQAAFRLLQIGDISPVVSTQFGWHVIQLVEIRPSYQAPAHLKIERLTPKILNARTRQVFQSFLESLRSQSTIVVFEQDLMLPISQRQP